MKTQDYNEIFNVLQKGVLKRLKKGERHNRKGRIKYPFAMMDRIGIKSYTHLKSEYEKIQNKQSDRSSVERVSISMAYQMCVDYKMLGQTEKT